MTAERLRMPKQDATNGAKVGYVGDVEIYEQKGGWSNAKPDLEALRSKIAAAKRELDEANADLERRREMRARHER